MFLFSWSAVLTGPRLFRIRWWIYKANNLFVISSKMLIMIIAHKTALCIYYCLQRGNKWIYIFEHKTLDKIFMQQVRFFTIPYKIQIWKIVQKPLRPTQFVKPQIKISDFFVLFNLKIFNNLAKHLWKSSARQTRI